MRLKLKETKDYVLALSEEEIKDGRTDFWVYDGLNDTCLFIKEICYFPNTKKIFAFKTYNDTISGAFNQEVVGYIPKNNAPDLDLPLLPESIEEDNVFEFDTAQLSQKEQLDFYMLMTTGKIKVKSSSNKVFTIEDLRKVIKIARGIREGKEIYEFEEDEIIQKINKLKTPKYFIAETYYERVDKSDFKGVYSEQHLCKVINEKRKIELVGRYE
jgi:hypothetical protein